MARLVLVFLGTNDAVALSFSAVGTDAASSALCPKCVSLLRFDALRLVIVGGGALGFGWVLGGVIS